MTRVGFMGWKRPGSAPRLQRTNCLTGQRERDRFTGRPEIRPKALAIESERTTCERHNSDVLHLWAVALGIELSDRPAFAVLLGAVQHVDRTVGENMSG